MELLAGLSIGILVYLAFFFDVAGFMARDELVWRSLMFTASAFYLVYYFFVVEEPLWDALITNGILAGVNLCMIGVVILERSTIGMNRHTISLFGHFPLLSPGQFRRLLRAGSIVTAESDTVMVVEGKSTDHLYFVIDGEITVDKDGRSAVIEPGVFIAEIAFLTNEPASATVSIAKGAEYIQWSATSLNRILQRTPSLRAALVANLNIDLAKKVARSRPIRNSEFPLAS